MPENSIQHPLDQKLGGTFTRYDKGKKQLSVTLSSQMPSPRHSFYADGIIVTEIKYGYKLIAFQTNPIDPARVGSAVQLVFDTASFKNTKNAIRSIKEELLKNCPDGGVICNKNDYDFSDTIFHPAQRVMIAFAVTSGAAISIDFYNIPAIDFHRASQDEPYNDLTPIIRIELLAGRLDPFLGDSNN